VVRSIMIISFYVSLVTPSKSLQFKFIYLSMSLSQKFVIL